MSDANMVSYGVKKLIMINSGTVEYLQLDLEVPLHLNADNNLGKTSTVNTLQFLYIDKMDDMFLPSSIQHSVEFYFRNEYSYLIFECVSKSGTHCVVLNRASGSRRHYNRYIWKGGYEQNLFIGPDSQPRDWPGVLDTLAGKGIMPVNVSKKMWWRVLSGLTDKRDRKELPALFILPIKDLESYQRFKMIYRNLLSMSQIKLDTFKDILLSCAVASGETRKIDFAEKEYKTRFENCRKLQIQHEYFLKNEQEIKKISEEEKELVKFQRKLPSAFTLLRWNYDFHIGNLTSDIEKEKARLVEIEEEYGKLIREREELSEQLGGIKKNLDDIQRNFAEYNELEQNSDLFVYREQWSLEELKEHKESLDREFYILDYRLKDVKKYTRTGLEERKHSIQCEIDKYQHLLDNEHLLFEHLLKEGISESELAKLAKLFHPELLTRPMKDVEIIDLKLFIKNIRGVISNISDGFYKDSSVTLPLPQNRERNLPDRGRAKEKISEMEGEFDDVKKLLELYIQEEDNLEKLAKLAGKRIHAAENLKCYERFIELQKEMPDLKASERDLTARSEKMTLRKKTCEELCVELREEMDEKRDSLESMNADKKLLNGDYIRLESTVKQHFSDMIKPDIKFKEEKLELEYLIDELSVFTRKIENLSSDLTAIILRKSQILEKVGLIYDRELDWSNFIEVNSDTVQANQRLDKEWQTFFGLAKHDFRSLVQCVDSIQSLLKSIDHTFNRQKISNLAKIKIRIESNDLYQKARDFTLDSDDLFTDPSKRRIYTSMFQTYFLSQITDLRAEDMFHIKIEITNPNNPAESKNITSFENESEGTNYTIKALLLSQLLKEQFKYGLYQKNIVFHYYLDEIGQLDEENLSNIVKQNKEKNLLPITAAPRPVIEPLCHPECKIVTLREHPKSKLTYIASECTFNAEQIRRNEKTSVPEEKNE